MEYELWLGSLALYHSWMQRREAIPAAISAGTWADNEDDEDDEDDDGPVNFTLFGNVAVIDIKGALTNDDSWYTRYCGDTSYNQIRRALVEAYTHPSVKAILCNIDSGGGAVSGLSDVGDMMRQISKSGMPVHCYSDGQMCSAAYWLGSAGDKVGCSETATLGSIGVIAIHRDITGMLKQDGIKATVIRAGSEKALSNPFEPLSKKAEESMQSKLDAMYEVFTEHIAYYRNVPHQYVLDNMANGREFVGKQALEAGLADKIISLDTLIADLQSTIDKQGKDTEMKRKTGQTVSLSAVQQAALLEGVPLESLESVQTTETTSAETPATETTETSASANPEPLVAQTSVTAESDIVVFMRSELNDKNKEVITLSTKLAALEAKVSTFESVEGPMKKIVADSISRMQIVLGGSSLMDLSVMDTTLLLALHAKTTETFKAKLPVGGVAAITPDESPKENATSSPIDQARFRQAAI